MENKAQNYRPELKFVLPMKLGRMERVSSAKFAFLNAINVGVD